MVTCLVDREVSEYVIYLSFRATSGIYEMLQSKLGKRGLYENTVQKFLLETTYSSYQWCTTML